MFPLLEVENLSKSFIDNAGLLTKGQFQAVDKISFRLERQKTLAIIGHNGAGKSTLVKMIVGITRPTSGNIFFNGNQLTFGDYKYRAKHIRMVFQDVNNSFNPRLNVGQILDAPLRIATDLTELERNEKIAQALHMVGLYPDHANTRINTMSFSQKQQIALARAIILSPEIIIVDDSLSVLDASSMQLMNLMLKLQERLGIAYIYVGQHIGIIKHIADEILLMDDGRMIEYGQSQQVLSSPKTEIARRLVESYFGKELDANAWK